MTQRARILLMLIGLVVGVSAIYYRHFQAANVSIISLDPGIGPRQTPLTDVPPEEMPKMLQEIYRLQPDARVLAAVKTVAMVDQPPQTDIAEVVFGADGQWTIPIGNDQSFKLPEYPDFQALEQLLEAAAGKAAARPKGSAAAAASRSVEQCDTLQPSKLFATLKALDQTWRDSKSPLLLLAAARCYAMLAILASDSNRLSDPVVARAIAVTYAARKANNSELFLERALLASVLGYRADAISFAQKAGTSGETVLAFLTDDAKRLRAALDGKNELSRYLALRSPVISDSSGSWEQLAGIYDNPFGPLYVADSGLRRRRFELNRAVPQLVNAAIAADLTELSSAERGQTPPSINYLDVDQQITVAAKEFEGSLVTPAVFKSFYQSHLFGSAYTVAHHVLFELASPQAAAAFLESQITPWQSAGNSDAQVLADWIMSHIQNQAPGSSREKLLMPLAQVSALGPDAYGSTIVAHSRHFRDRAGEKMTPVAAFVKAFDSRPRNRMLLAAHISNYGRDIKLRGMLWRSLLATESQEYPNYSYIQWLAQTGERKQVEALLKNPSTTSKTRLAIFSDLRSNGGMTDEEYETALKGLVQISPEDWAVVQTYGDHLLSTERNEAEVVSVVRRWLEAHPERDMRFISAVNLLASALYRLGRYDEAWEENSRVVESGQGESMRRHVLLLIVRNQMDEAADAAAKARARYGQYISGITPSTRLLWAKNNYQEAAQELAAWVGAHRQNDWAEFLASEFYLAFKNRPVEERAQAMSALATTDMFPVRLMAIPAYYAGKQLYEDAFQLLQQVRVPGGELTLSKILLSYEYLKSARSSAEALAWLKGQMTPQQGAMATIQLFNTGDYELLWELADDMGNSDFVWLPRAMASIQKTWDATPYQERLLARYRAGGQELYFKCGEYLLDLLPQEELLKEMTSDRARMLGSFYLGLKEESKGNLRAAHDWYRITIELDNYEMAESYWAMTRLADWERRGMTASLLQ